MGGRGARSPAATAGNDVIASVGPFEILGNIRAERYRYTPPQRETLPTVDKTAPIRTQFQQIRKIYVDALAAAGERGRREGNAKLFDGHRVTAEDRKRLKKLKSEYNKLDRLYTQQRQAEHDRHYGR